MCYYVKTDWESAIIWPSSLAVRMPPCHGGGRRFKSDLGRHYSWIAQLVEQSAVNRSVVGSSPTPGAIYYAGIAQR